MDMRLRILFVFICRFQIVVTAIEPGCEKCGCCVDNVCADHVAQAKNVKEYCTRGCTPGFGGNKCYNKCPGDCVTCKQTSYNNCATCRVGTYLSTGKRCVDCPSNCATCSSMTLCQECKSLYYNHQGEIKNCSLSCPRNCVCLSPGVCSTCQNGNFNVNEQCIRACPDTCKNCSGKSNCQFCNVGYYNGRESLTNTKVTDCSLRCRDTCVHCTSYNACTFCKQGHYGSYCQNNCSVACTNGECDANDGSCVCKDGFVGIHCTECAAGRHGEQCEKQCPVTCKGTACRRETGNCLECESLNMTGNACDICVNGTWGTDCSSECQRQCDGQCKRYSGYCEGCKENFPVDKCDDCISGFHGFECKDCVAGMYGQKCDVPCHSTKCSNNICNRDTGNCETCDYGYFGVTCDKICPITCTIDGQEFHCEKAYGKCVRCTEGFHGDHCNKTCSDRCFNSRCDKDNGHCAEGCTGDYVGPTCAQAKDTASIVGIAVGIASAVVFVMMIILISTLFLIFKRWKRNNQQGQVAHASYVNVEFQPVIPDTQHTQQEYEELGAINERDGTYMYYEQLDTATLQDSN